MKNFLKNQDNLIILFVSFIAFIAGCLAKHPFISIIVVIIADVFFFYPEISKIISKRKNGTKPKIKSLEKVQNKVNKIKNSSPKKKKKWKKIILLIILFFIIAVIAGIIVFTSYIVVSAPKFDPDQLYSQEPSILYDADGEEIAKIGAEKRKNINYDDLPEVLVDAIIATEDSNFFQHNGFDLSRFIVASFKQVFTGGGGGASTLTMQVVKNTFTSTTSTGFEGIKRKFTDIYMSVFQVEKKYTKQEILEFYVNSYYLGSGAYGVEQASQTYFNKSSKDLSLSEAAMIAGLFQAPTAYDPYQHPDKAEQRRNQVLKLMLRHNYITKDEYNTAISISVEDMLVTSTDDGSTKTNEWQAFIDLVVEDVVEDTGMDPYKVSMKIYTTMDREKQAALNDIMNGTTYQWQNDVVTAGISVQDVKTGAIVAVGAGRNRVGERQYNTATMINRQIGSTAKPIYDYAPGIEYEDWSTYKLFDDSPYTYSDGTTILNWDRSYEGTLTLRNALAHSRNIPALKAFQENKNSNILSFVQSLGLHPEVTNGIIHEAHSIGGYTGESPRDMAAAYAAFGNGGYYITPHSYTKIIVNETNEEIECTVSKKRVMSEETAYMMTSLLQSSAQYGLGNSYNLGTGAIYGAKTGTSNFDSATIAKYGFGSDTVNDLWVDAVSPDYAISVWYGYTSINPDYVSTSYTVAHRTLFNAVAKKVFKSSSNWTKPSGVSEVKVLIGSNPAVLASDSAPEGTYVVELFKSGTEPTETTTKYDTLPNVTDLKGSVSGTKLTLSWKAVSVSSDSTLGDIVYKVYSKDSSGNLTHLKDVSDTSTTLTISSSSPDTYVVKTAYTSFSTNISSGASVKVTLPEDTTVNISLTVSASETVAKDANVTYSASDVKVLSGSKDVTSSATITIYADDVENGLIDTSTAGTHTIKYVVSYKDTKKTLTRTITVQE